ncbi:MAG: hypothetical protein DMG76_19565 [Acidobacteria bacterium]|nr:MAG: hypothetical protein DMG76_19565 [Acidobacteriota bacterium]
MCQPFAVGRQRGIVDLPDRHPGHELRGYHAKESKEDGAETTEFYIRWVSSRTLREASARRLALLRQVPPNAVKTSPPKVLEEFEVAIAGPDMSGFDGVREPALRSKCYLWASSRCKIAPWRVEFARSGNGKVLGVLFRFPRKAADENRSFPPTTQRCGSSNTAAALRFAWPSA